MIVCVCGMILINRTGGMNIIATDTNLVPTISGICNVTVMNANIISSDMKSIAGAEFVRIIKTGLAC